MYYKEINPIGCFIWLIILTWLFFALKIYYLVFAAIIVMVAVYYYFKLKKSLIEKKEEQERNFEPQMGEVYKICPNCGNNVKRNASACPHCNHKFD
jgi:uncharacterized membrane protein YraQ (UPF0718 family)